MKRLKTIIFTIKFFFVAVYQSIKIVYAIDKQLREMKDIDMFLLDKSKEANKNRFYEFYNKDKLN